jgi:predicted dehydrogenase
MRELGIGLIGTGFMGRAHALAFNNARAVFELPVTLKLAALADADTERAQRCASAWGFAQAHGDWQALIDDPKVDVVAITTPNHLHYPMAMAAIAAGKAVYCEKPLAVSLEQADAMRRAANAAGVVTRVGYNYQHNPMIGLARQMIAKGELGEIISFQGEFSLVMALRGGTRRRGPGGFGQPFAVDGALFGRRCTQRVRRHPDRARPTPSRQRQQQPQTHRRG